MPKKTTDPYTKLALLLRSAPLEPKLKLSIIEATSHAKADKLEQVVQLAEGLVKEIWENEKKFKEKLNNIQEAYDAKTEQLTEDTNIQLTKLDGQLDEVENSAKLKGLRKSI